MFHVNELNTLEFMKCAKHTPVLRFYLTMTDPAYDIPTVGIAVGHVSIVFLLLCCPLIFQTQKSAFDCEAIHTILSDQLHQEMIFLLNKDCIANVSRRSSLL